MTDAKKKSSPGMPSVESLTENNSLNLCANYTTSLQRLQEEIDKKFLDKKKQTDILGTAYSILDLESRSRRVLDCGTFLEFKVSADKAKLQHANFCKDRLCPMCNWRRSLKIFAQVSQVMDVLQNEGYQFLFLTLTVRNCSAEDLPKTVSALFDGWRYLYNKNSEFRKVILGTFRSLEVTRNKKDNTYHPHLHCILAVKSTYFARDNYISQRRWTELWQNACDLNYSPIVHIQKCYTFDADGNKQTEGIDVSKAVSEATKYAVKGSDFLNGSDLDESTKNVEAFLSALSRRRLCGWTGCFQQARKQLRLDDAEDGDLVHTDTDAIREDVACMVVQYSWRSGAYVRL